MNPYLRYAEGLSLELVIPNADALKTDREGTAVVQLSRRAIIEQNRLTSSVVRRMAEANG